MNNNAKALRIDADDSVAIALDRIDRGESIRIDQGQSWPRNPSLRAIRWHWPLSIPERRWSKYGHAIGRTTQPIAPGQWIHSHNLQTALHGTRGYVYQPGLIPVGETGEAHVFQGYLRQDGRAGIRNELWIIPTVGCINSVAEMLATKANAEFGGQGSIDGVYHFAHTFGCSQLGGDLNATQRLLAAMVQHPNAGGILVVGLGCENNQIDDFKKSIGPYDAKRVKFYNLQDVDEEITQGMTIVEELALHAASARRERLPASKLVPGMKCGGSDAFSGVTANPLLGEIADRIVVAGGSALLTEVPEMFGAETILMNRANDDR